MKIALVGIGKIAVDQHIPAINNSADWELAATVSRTGSVGGVEAFDDFDAMLQQRPDIRVVSLCLPPVPRFEYAIKAISAGRHVMLEKPPGATLSECQTLENMAKKKGISLYATWHSRQADMVPQAKTWLEAKTLKKLKISWRENVRQWHPGQDWVFEAGGMGVFDPGINALSILTEIVSDALHITKASLEFPQNKQTPIAAHCQFYHPNGADVSMELDWLEEGDPIWTIEAETDQGKMTLENGGGKLAIDGTLVDARDGFSGEYPRLYAQMSEIMRDGAIDMDLSPLCHVVDAFALGERKIVAPFNW